MVRIISGLYKRRQLQTPPGFKVTRPTSDRVKESLFNILSGDVDGARVLDLFAGSGSLGFECLSRGAAHVSFVDNHPVAQGCIVQNAKTLAVPAERFAVMKRDVSLFLKEARSPLIHRASITLVFADPPYASPWYDQALAELLASGLCAPGCLFCVEMDAGLRTLLAEDAAVWPRLDAGSALWQRVDVRVYGKARYEFWRFEPNEK